MPRSLAPRTTAGAASCLAPRASAATEVAAAAAPQSSLKAVFPWLNGLQPRPSARQRATGKPTPSCLQNTVRPRWPFWSGERASFSLHALVTEPPSGSRATSSGYSGRCPRSCARLSPSTMAVSSPDIAGCTSSRSAPTSATPIPPGRRAPSRTQSGACAASFLGRPILQPCRPGSSKNSSAPTTTHLESVLTSGPQPKPSLKCCTSSVNPPPRFRGNERKIQLP